MRYGMSYYEIKQIILESVERNPDLKYYINNDYIYELVDAILDGVSIAIERNAETVLENIQRDLRNGL